MSEERIFEGFVEAGKEFLKSLSTREGIRGVLAPVLGADDKTVMPVLISNPAYFDRALLFSPAFPLNAARLVSRLTRRPGAGRTAVVLRPCEIRALVELVKLKQASLDDLILIGLDCPGAVTNKDYQAAAAEKAPEDLTREFAAGALDGSLPGFDLAPACRICELPTPDLADIALGLFREGNETRLWVQGRTEAGNELLEKTGRSWPFPPEGREAELTKLIEARTIARDEAFAAVREKVDDPVKLAAYFAGCVNCYNCRTACPVCYCRECVFSTDVFEHDPWRYLQWAERKGALRMPTDTVFFHLTRMIHMAAACVGCGQCSNACPNDIPLAEVFRMIADQVQAGFDYRAGESLDSPPPLAVFREDELQEVVGL